MNELNAYFVYHSPGTHSRGVIRNNAVLGQTDSLGVRLRSGVVGARRAVLLCPALRVPLPAATGGARRRRLRLPTLQPGVQPLHGESDLTGVARSIR